MINTSSSAAMKGQFGQATYASSKAGVAGLTLPAARDLAALGIRVCAIAPSIIATPMMAEASEQYRQNLLSGVLSPRRFGKPEEYSDLVLNILDNDYINDEVIRIDGALRMVAR